MDFVNFVMALSPILVVLVGILGFKQSAKRVAPIALVWTLVLAFTYFNVTGATFAENVKTWALIPSPPSPSPCWATPPRPPGAARALPPSTAARPW